MSYEDLAPSAPGVAVVTGAAQGIGAAIAEHLASLNATVVLLDILPAVADTSTGWKRFLLREWDFLWKSPRRWLTWSDATPPTRTVFVSTWTAAWS